MADVSGSDIRGFLVPSDRLNKTIWDAESTYTQAGPRVGSVEPASTSSRLALQASGELAADQAITILTNQPGNAGPGGAGFVWRNTADAATLYRGRDTGSISGFEPIEWVDGSGTIKGTSTPHAVVLPNQTIVLAYQDRTLAKKRVRVRTRARDGSWSAAITVFSETLGTQAYHPCVWTTPAGDVLLAFWVRDTLPSPAEANVRIYRSTDDGSSWNLWAEAALNDPVSLDATVGSGATGFTVDRLRAAHMDGQTLIMAGLRSHDTSRTWRSTYRQYASSSGVAFDLIETGGEGLFVDKPDIVVTPAGMLVTYLTTTTTINKRQSRLAVDAYVPFSNLDSAAMIFSDDRFGELDASLKYAEDSDAAACVGDAGEVYHLSRITTNAALASLNVGAISRSNDGGSTWEALGLNVISGLTSVGVWWACADHRTYPSGFCAVYSEGRIVVIGNHTANPGSYDDSLAAVYIGGPSTVTMPGRRSSKRDNNRATWDLCWLPFDLPTDTYMNGSGTATTEAIHADGYLELSCSSTQTRYFYGDSSTITELVTPVATGSIVGRFAVQMMEGGSSGTDRMVAEYRLADGTNSYRVAIYLEALGFALWDTIAGTRIGSAVVISGAHEFIVSIAAGTASCWYRARSLNADRSWTVGPSGSLSDGGAAYASNRVLFGSKGTSPATTCTARWWEFHVSAASSGAGLASGQTNPDDLMPTTYAGPGYGGSYVTAGAKLTARGGPAHRAETFSMVTDYAYPLSRVRFAESPSPKVGWRSTSTAEAQIAFALDDTLLAAAESHLESDTLGLVLLGCNWRTGRLEGYDVGSGWTSIATIDASTNLSWASSWARIGNTLVPTPRGASGTFLHKNELAGGVAIISGTKRRRIQSNTEGSVVSTATPGARPRIVLEDVDGTESTAGITLQVHRPDFVVLVNLLGARYAGFRLVIDSQDTIDGDLRIGNMAVCYLHAFGHQPSWGRVVELVPNVADQVEPNGARHLAVKGPPRRQVDIAWTEGVVTDQAFDDSAVGDYITASTSAGAKALASTRATPFAMQGLFEGLFRDGAGSNPGIVCYLPRVPRVTDGQDVTHLTRRHEFVVGYCDGPARVETLQGDENRDEVARVSTITIRELA